MFLFSVAPSSLLYVTLSLSAVFVFAVACSIWCSQQDLLGQRNRKQTKKFDPHDVKATDEPQGMGGSRSAKNKKVPLYSKEQGVKGYLDLILLYFKGLVTFVLD